MLSKALIAVCLFQAAVTIGSSTKPVCPSGWISLSTTQSCYYFSKIKTDWSSARSSCRKLGGDLVVFENINENNAISKIAQQRGFSNPWIGLVRHSDNKFYTVYGSKPTYTNWAPGEPNNPRGERCGLVWTHRAGQWNDGSCPDKFHFICERAKLTPVRKLYCGENSMKLVVRKSYFNVSSGTQLQLLDSSCRPRETKLHYIFTTSLTGCGTTITTDSQGRGTVSFANKIIERRSAFGSSITRSKQTQLPFSCHYPRSYLVSSLPSFGLVDAVTTLENVTGQGNITLVMDLYKDKSFRQSLDTKPSLDKRMYVEIRIQNATNSSTTQSSSGIKLNECYATSIGSQPVYRHILIEHGCPKDKTVKFHQSPGITARFSFQAFRFRGLHHYTTRIHCRATVCETSSKSCQVKCPSNGKRKRALFEQEDENITYLY